MEQNQTSFSAAFVCGTPRQHVRQGIIYWDKHVLSCQLQLRLYKRIVIKQSGVKIVKKPEEQASWHWLAERLSVAGEIFPQNR